MKTQLLLAALLLPGLLGAADDKPPAGWKPFTSPDGGFTIFMPEKPERHKQVADTDVGRVDVHLFMATPEGNQAFSVDYADLPAGSEIQVDAMIRRAASTYQAKVLSNKKIKLGDYPGREARLDLPGKGLVIRIRAYVVKNRQYRVMLAARKDYVDSEEADRFFNSFRLVTPSKKEPAPRAAASGGKDSVTLLVHLPARATLSISGDPTREIGSVRRFSSSGLEPGAEYSYQLKATWKKHGKEIVRERTVAFRAGTTVVVDLYLPGEDDSPNRTPTSAVAWMMRANRLMRDNDARAAAAAGTEAVKLDPRDARAYRIRARAHYMTEDWEASLKDCVTALGLEPDDAEGYCIRAFAHMGQEKPDQALADCDAALRIDPESAEAYSNRAWAYSHKEDYDRAIAECEKGKQYDPKLNGLYANLGYCYNQKGDYQKGIAYCTQAIELYPYHSHAYNNRGYAYWQLGQYNQALADFDQALRVKPTNLTPKRNRAGVYRDTGQYAQARAEYDELIRLEPKNVLNRNLRAELYLSAKDYDQVIQLTEEIIRLDPSNARAWNDRGAAYSWKNNYVQAVADYTQAIQFDPRYAKAYQNRAKAYQSLGRSAEAEADLRMYRQLKK